MGLGTVRVTAPATPTRSAASHATATGPLICRPRARRVNAHPLLDTEQRLARVTNSLALEWSYTYDAGGQLICETDLDGLTSRYAYDATGLLPHARPA
ncbi:RHS repeat domain-containing protein [Streptomyces sp. NPDC048425]|uniref:RHS repeat domain-containing protein n=1 Tax=Streptomyces sp. NPDC048425 TaxID=3365548 RepID=UPI00372057A9